MALKGLDIFKLTPKTNCRDCGVPTCMAFSMKVAQGSVPIDKCPHLAPGVIEQLSEATAPPMRTVTVGAGAAAHTLGGETVLMRHEKTFVNKCLYGVRLCDDMDGGRVRAILDGARAVDYERIGERMTTEVLYLSRAGGGDGYLSLAARCAAEGRAIVLDCTDEADARAALELCGGQKPVLHGATPGNYEAMNALAAEFGVPLGVRAGSLSELYDTAAALEALGNKNLLLDVGTGSIKEAFAAAVQMRRAAILDGERALGYPSIVNAAALAPGDRHLQTALAALFTLKYGSVIVTEEFGYAESLPLHGLRQNIFTDPQKPMTVEPGIYALNGADENAVCATTVDFALTYFVVTGELERSGVPVNLLISNAGGYSVLTAWAAGKLTASSIAKFVKEAGVEDKVKNRTLIIPGKVAVLKGEVEDKLPGWKILVGPNEAIQLVKFMKELVKS